MVELDWALTTFLRGQCPKRQVSFTESLTKNGARHEEERNCFVGIESVIGIDAFNVLQFPDAKYVDLLVIMAYVVSKLNGVDRNRNKKKICC